MFFIFSKLIETALLPSNLIALIGGLGLLALIFRRRKVGLTLLVVSCLLLMITGWTPLGPASIMVLEDRFPPADLPAEITGIVMLGGAVDTHVTENRGMVALNDNAERVVAVATLAHRYPQARILLSGGSAHVIIGQGQTESEVARRLLVELGVPENRIEMETRSRTTFENAANSVTIAKPQPGQTWLLLTSAYNMPRAMASFRAANFPIVPYPTDFRTRPADLRRPVGSIAGGLALVDMAAHEWLGLLGYRLTGKTQEFLPGR